MLWSTNGSLSNGMRLWGLRVRDLSKMRGRSLRNEVKLQMKGRGGGGIKKNELRKSRKKKGRYVVEEEVVKPVKRG